jgi:hypothetical protein
MHSHRSKKEGAHHCSLALTRLRFCDAQDCCGQKGVEGSACKCPGGDACVCGERCRCAKCNPGATTAAV